MNEGGKERTIHTLPTASTPDHMGLGKGFSERAHKGKFENAVPQQIFIDINKNSLGRSRHSKLNFAIKTLLGRVDSACNTRPCNDHYLQFQFDCPLLPSALPHQSERSWWLCGHNGRWFLFRLTLGPTPVNTCCLRKVLPENLF